MARTSDKDLLEAHRLARKGVINAPQSFKDASLEKLREFCNGCGAKGSWFRPPKRIYGTLIIYACIVHDWQYSFGLTNDDKCVADRTFKHNMNRLITRDSQDKWYKPTGLQRTRALIYYFFVKEFGGEAFWTGKPNA